MLVNQNPHYDKLFDLLANNTGIYFRVSDKKRLVPEIDHLIKKEDLHLEGLIQMIETGEALTKPFYGPLINLITTEETYFLRDKDQLNIIQHKILPLVADHAEKSEESLLIWSAGCSSGEEPYSLAFLAYQRLASHIWQNLTIYGTDINHVAISQAKNAEYSTWSLRGIQDTDLIQLCQPVKNGWQVKQQFRAKVKLSVLNLTSAAQIHQLFKSKKPLIVLCRNVFIYMDKKTRQSILNTFREVIHEDGFLLTGHTEIQDLDKSDWVAVQHSGTSVYRPRIKSKKYQKSQPLELQPVKELPFKKKEKKVALNRPVIKSSRVVAKESIKRAASPQRVIEKTAKEPAMQVGDYFTKAYNLAMSDRESEALDLIEQLIKKDPLFSEAYYLRAILSRNRDQSRADLQRLLYLQPNHLMGNIEIASLHESAGDKEKSQRFFKNAMQILNNEQQVSENILYGEEDLESLHSLLKVKLGS